MYRPLTLVAPGFQEQDLQFLDPPTLLPHSFLGNVPTFLYLTHPPSCRTVFWGTDFLSQFRLGPTHCWRGCRLTRLGSVLGSAQLSSARRAWFGTARLGVARLASALLGSVRLGTARLVSARLGSSRLGSARHGSSRRGSARC